VHLRLVLDHDQLERGHVETQLFAGPGAVLQQSCFIFVISPGVGHDSRATLGVRLRMSSTASATCCSVTRPFSTSSSRRLTSISWK